MVNINYKGLKLNVKNVNGTLELEIKNNEGVHDCLLFITSEGVGYSKYNDEGDYTVVSMQYCQYNEGEVNESEGYVEVMGDDFDEAVDQIVFAWEQWKNGPATEPEDIEPARQDVVDYIKSLLK